MVPLRDLPLLLSMAASLASHSDARHVHPPRNVATPAEVQFGSLSIRDSLARGADPLELYHSIKVARAEAQANGRTIDVPEDDLRAILDQIDDLHDEVDALLTGTTEEKEEDDDSGDTSTDAKASAKPGTDSDASQKPDASDESLSDPGPVSTSEAPAEATLHVEVDTAASEDGTASKEEQKPKTSGGDKVSGPKPYFDVDNFLDSVSFKQKTPVDPVEENASESLADTAQPSSSVSQLSSSGSTSKNSESTNTAQQVSVTSSLAVPEADASALISTTSTSTTDNLPRTSTLSGSITNAPALKAAITTSVASSASESSDEEVTTTTVTSTLTRTITLTEAHKNNGTSTITTEQTVTSEVEATQTPSAPIVNLKAINQVDSDSQTLASTTSTAESAGITMQPSTSASAATTTGVEVSSGSSASTTSLDNVSESSSAITQSSTSSGNSKGVTASTVDAEPAIKAIVSSSRDFGKEPSSSSAVESSAATSEVSTISSITATEEAAATPPVLATDTTSSGPKSESSVEPVSTVAPSDLTISVPPPASSESVTGSELVDPAVKVIVTSTANSNVTLTGFRTMVRV